MLPINHILNVFLLRVSDQSNYQHLVFDELQRRDTPLTKEQTENKNENLRCCFLLLYLTKVNNFFISFMYNFCNTIFVKKDLYMAHLKIR